MLFPSAFFLSLKKRIIKTKSMLQRPPIALVVFSNDLGDYLSYIEADHKAIAEALEHDNDFN